MPVIPASISDRKPPPGGLPEGRFRVTIRVERPDGQFVTSSRDIPADLLDGPFIDDPRPSVYGLEISRAFLAAVRRAAELPD